jgi:prolyl-tRNA synthetase
MVIPIQQRKEGVLDAAYDIAARLKAFRVKTDDSDRSPGYKFADQEMRGIPLRIEIGPKDLENGKCVLVRRDTGEKIECAIDGVTSKVTELLPMIQSDMLAKAQKHLQTHTFPARNKEEFAEAFQETRGFVKAMWCGCRECEEKIKEEMNVTSRCIPFEQENLSDTCVYCGKPAKKMVYWGRAY